MSINIKTEDVIIEEEIESTEHFNCVVKGGETPEITGDSDIMEAEKRIRREIANSNERRRMQSINAGFQSLRTLLPHHEGEKLSKAAILQQTAEYIYSLEQEKTRLLSQNCQLKRLVNQQEGGNEAPPKKRKLDANNLIIPNILSAESSDEGIDSLSPEPVGIIAVGAVTKIPPQTTTITATNNNNAVTAAAIAATNAELLEVKAQLERERRHRMLLEDQLRTLESQVVYSSQMYQNSEEAVLVSLPDDMQVVSMETVPPVAQTQTVESSSPPISRSPSPQQPPRLPSALEAAIKAEPKVEVERLPPSSPHHAGVDDMSPQTRLYVANTSRQNLETIVEAIRHLEGDHLFAEEPNKAGKQRGTVVSTTTGTASIVPTQDMPLALTTKPKQITQARLLQVEMNPFLQFHAASTTTVQQQQQTRPGVIVVKQHS